MATLYWIDDRPFFTCPPSGGTDDSVIDHAAVEIINIVVPDLPMQIVKPDIQYGPRRKRGKGKYHKY